MQPARRNERADGRSGDLVSRTRFDAGRACLNLLATVGRRGDAPVERVPTPQACADWLVDAGLVEGPVTVNESRLNELHALRKAAYQVVEARRCHAQPDADAVAAVNAWAARSTAAPQLTADAAGATQHSPRPVAAALATLARDTISLVTGPDMARVRACTAPECRMLFLDHSRGARRRWCSMARCGNRAKVRTHARKTRQRDPDQAP